MTEAQAEVPADGAPGSVRQRLTAVVIAPGWALAYGAAVLLLNLALQFGARSERVLAPLRVLVSDMAGSGAGPIEILLVFLLVGVVAPFVEEVTFRGSCSRVFSRRGAPGLQ